MPPGPAAHTPLASPADGERRSKAARKATQDGSNPVYVSAAVAWEIAIKKALGKLDAPDNLEEVMEANRFSSLPIMISHALALRMLPDHHRDPVDRMRELVMFTWSYFIQHPEFLSLLATENLNRASYLKKSRRIRDLHSPLLGMISTLLARGAKEGKFRRSVDPVQLYITIAALGFFYFSNRYTLSTIFAREFAARGDIDERGPAYRRRRARLSAAGGKPLS